MTLKYIPLHSTFLLVLMSVPKILLLLTCLNYDDVLGGAAAGAAAFLSSSSSYSSSSRSSSWISSSHQQQDNHKVTRSTVLFSPTTRSSSNNIRIPPQKRQLEQDLISLNLSPTPWWNNNNDNNNKNNKRKPTKPTTITTTLKKQQIPKPKVKSAASSIQQGTPTPSRNEISAARKQQLGIVNEREYDLDLALERNTDPLITKIIAGSFILVVIGLLVAGIVVPSLTDYGEGVCNPIRTAGRC